LLLFAGALFGASCGVAAAETVTTNHNYIKVANDDGVKFYNWDYSYYGDGGGIYGGAIGPNTYLVKADGGGTNELRISSTTTAGGVVTQASTSNNPSGSFFVTNSGGRGFDNDIIIALAVTGPVSDNFGVRVKSSGYVWTAPPSGNYDPTVPTDYVFVQGIDKTFGKADFLYGPQVLRPGTSSTIANAIAGALPIFYSDTVNPSTPAYLMFIDLKVGNIKSTTISGLTNDGAAKVDFSFTGLDQPTKIAFAGYGWCSASKQSDGINWTSAMTGSSASGYYIDATPADITPPAVASTEPAAAAVGMAVGTPIRIVFSERMDPSSIDGASLSVNGITGAVSYDDATNTATFTPDMPLLPGTSYTVTAAGTVKDADGNAMRNPYSWSFTTALPRLTVGITGSGSVNDLGGTGFSCASGSCGRDFQYGAAVTLHASPSSGYGFNGWTGACSGTADCNLTMTSDYNSDANFSVLPYISTGGVYYPTLQEALNTASNGGTVQTQALTFTVTSLQFNRPGTSVILAGGYDPLFQSNGGFTTVDGALKVQNGTLRVSKVKIM